MILRFLAISCSMIAALLLASLVIKPVKVEAVKVSDYRDPLGMARDIYSKMLWQDMSSEPSAAKRFSILKRVVDYTPAFKPAYEELCRGIREYSSSGVEVRELLRMAQQGAENFEDATRLNCYVSALTGMQRYIEALNFLNQQYIQYQDTPRQDFYMDRIRKLQHENNILTLTKAVETYYQKTKAYPGDILVLVNEGFIDKMPEDPYGGQYFISRQGQIKSTSEITKNEN